MANPARHIHFDTAAVALPAAAEWSGELHGSVADMHRAIEAGLGRVSSSGDAAAVPAPFEAAQRLLSRVFGWTVLILAVGLLATAIL